MNKPNQSVEVVRSLNKRCMTLDLMFQSSPRKKDNTYLTHNMEERRRTYPRGKFTASNGLSLRGGEHRFQHCLRFFHGRTKYEYILCQISSLTPTYDNPFLECLSVCLVFVGCTFVPSLFQLYASSV